jgi:hypothetical protein
MANTTWSATDKSANVTLSGGNLVALNSNGANSGGRAAWSWTTGKYYWEVICNVIGGSGSSGIGVANTSAAVNFISSGYAGACALQKLGSVILNNSASVTGVGALSNGSIVCVALALDNRRVWFRRNAAGNWNANASYNPATNVGGIDFSVIGGSGVAIFPCYGTDGNLDQYTANFGDSAFTGAVPSGFTSGFLGPPTENRVTQVSIEEFATANPNNQATQVALEMWATTAGVTVQALVTQVALEMWAPGKVRTGRVNVWNGSAWIKEDVLSFRSGASWDTAAWDGSYWAPDSWHPVPVKYWNGTAWVLAS